MGLRDDAASTAARQHGAVSRAQLIDLGWTDRRIEDAARLGETRRVHRGVFVVAGSPATALRAAWAAHLAVGPTSVVSGLTALALYGIERIPFPVLPTILVPYNDAPTRPEPGLNLVRSRTFEPAHGTVLDGLPLVTLPRLPIEVASTLRTGDLAAVLRDVIRRTGCSPHDLLETVHEAGNRAGTRRLRQLLAEMDPGHARTASVAEGRLLALLTRFGLPPAIVNHTVFEPDGTVLGVLDFAWPELMAAVELDSLRHHATSQAQAHDLERQQRFERRGWRFRRVTPRQVAQNPTWVANLIREFLAQQAPTSQL